MSDNLLKADIRTIYNECIAVSQGIVQDEPLEERMEREFGTFGAYYAMPFVFERIEQDDNVQAVIDTLFPENAHTVNQEQLVQYAAQYSTLEENEEQVDIPAPVVPVVEVAPVPEPKVKVARQPRQKSSESLSGRAWPLYQNMYNINSDVRNVDAQRAIAGELDITDSKQLNSLRALVVKFKKRMQG